MNRCCFALFLGFISFNTFAARPFVTDDARLTTASSCQLESWTRLYKGSQEAWALPACNPSGNLEFTFGGGRARNEGEKSTADYVFQAKTLWRPLRTNDWGAGLAMGTIRHPEISPGPNQLGNTYAYLPLSISIRDDVMVLHTNVGWLKDRATRQDRLTWGVGAELQLSPRFLAIAEAYGDNHARPYWQLGSRFAIVPDLLQVDATVGQQFSGPGATRWISFGLRLTPASLF